MQLEVSMGSELYEKENEPENRHSGECKSGMCMESSCFQERDTIAYGQLLQNLLY
jgi:hypothetical protein